MSASRNSSMRALRQLSRHGQTRQLHMTEPKTFPAPALLSQKGPAATSTPSQKPVLTESSKAQVSDKSAPARPMSTTTMAGPARPTANTATQPSNTRTFNTSRTLRSQRDTSTMDFAFLPQQAGADVEPDIGGVRVPIVPDLWEPVRTGAQVIPPPDFEGVHRVQIATAAGEATHVAAPSAMSEVHDNESVPVDFDAIVDRLTIVNSSSGGGGGGQSSSMRQLWDGLVEDVFGGAKGRAALA